MLDTRNVEQTKYVLCTLKNIYSSRCSHIAVHGWTGLKWIALEECWFIYTRNKGMRYVRITLRCTIDTGDWIELQWVRNCHLWELNWELSFHCLARSCHLEVLMVISIDTLLIKQLRELLNNILVISIVIWQDERRNNSILGNMSSWHLYRCTFDRYHNNTQEENFENSKKAVDIFL